MQDFLIGRRMDGRRFYIPHVSRLEHILIGGKTGTGKSGLTSAVGAEAARCGDVAILGIDLKLMELALWRPRLTALANTADDASLLLGLVVGEIRRRNELLESHGLRFWETRFGPWIVLFIDELARLAGVAVEHLLDQANASTEIDPKTGRPVRLDAKVTRQAKDALAVRMQLIDWIVAVGRAAGVRLIAATQYPTADVIDSSIRTQFGMRFMLRVISREQVAVILGAGNEQHIQPDSIPVAERGGFWCVGNPGDSRAVRGRALMFNDATLANRFRTTSHLRIDQSELFKAPARHLHAVPQRQPPTKRRNPLMNDTERCRLTVADKINNGAAGSRTAEAAAIIIIETIRGRLVEQLALSAAGDDWAEINWPATRRTTGHLSGGERRLLALAESLATGEAVDLNDTLTGLDSTNSRIVLEAVAHAMGFSRPARGSSK